MEGIKAGFSQVNFAGRRSVYDGTSEIHGQKSAGNDGENQQRDWRLGPIMNGALWITMTLRILWRTTMRQTRSVHGKKRIQELTLQKTNCRISKQNSRSISKLESYYVHSLQSLAFRPSRYS